MIWFFTSHNATGNGDFTFLHKMDFCDDQAGIENHQVNVREAYICFRFLL
jgi:hypothetical protein